MQSIKEMCTPATARRSRDARGPGCEERRQMESISRADAPRDDSRASRSQRMRAPCCCSANTASARPTCSNGSMPHHRSRQCCARPRRRVAIPAGRIRLAVRGPQPGAGHPSSTATSRSAPTNPTASSPPLTISCPDPRSRPSAHGRADRRPRPHGQREPHVLGTIASHLAGTSLWLVGTATDRRVHWRSVRGFSTAPDSPRSPADELVRHRAGSVRPRQADVADPGELPGGNPRILSRADRPAAGRPAQRHGPAPAAAARDPHDRAGDSRLSWPG